MHRESVFIALMLWVVTLTACQQNNESSSPQIVDPNPTVEMTLEVTPQDVDQSQIASSTTDVTQQEVELNPVVDSTSVIIQNGYYFSSNRTGNYEIYHLVGEQLVNLTSDTDFDSWWPRQSPNGSTMLFYRSRVQDRPASGGHNNNYDNASLWSLNLISGELVELIATDANNWSAQGVVDWSPDGTQLVMAAIDKNTDLWNLYITDPRGLNPVRVSTRDSLYLDPSWSPDGSQIVFVAFPPDYLGFDLSRLEVYTADKNGTNETRLTNDAFRDHDPYWSPDGKSIAFETAVDPAFFGVGKWALRNVTVDTGIVDTLLDDGHINTLPRWSQDGTTLFFHRFTFGSDHGFIVASINADGTNYKAITIGGQYDDTDLDWYRVSN